MKTIVNEILHCKYFVLQKKDPQNGNIQFSLPTGIVSVGTTALENEAQFHELKPCSLY